MKHWQHRRPLRCPRGTPMLWLGLHFWLCDRPCCNQIWVETTRYQHYTQRESADDA